MFWFFLACSSSPPEHVIRGTVVEVRADDTVVIDHEAIPGVMEAMVMPFSVADPALLEGVDPGDKVRGTWVLAPDHSVLSALVVTEAAPPPAPVEHAPALAAGESVPVGAIFPATPLMLAQGAPILIGEGQDTGGPIALTFIYTRCPVPEFCPLVVSRFQALQEQLPPKARLIAVTMDPDYDTRSVLAEFGQEAGAKPGRWDFARVPKEVLFGLAEKAGLVVHGRGTGITHDLIMVVLDADGRVVERYHDFSWDMAQVVEQLGR